MQRAEHNRTQEIPSRRARLRLQPLPQSTDPPEHRPLEGQAPKLPIRDIATIGCVEKHFRFSYHSFNRYLCRTQFPSRSRYCHRSAIHTDSVFAEYERSEIRSAPATKRINHNTLTFAGYVQLAQNRNWEFERKHREVRADRVERV